MLISDAVRRYLHLYSTGTESHRLSRLERQSIHTKRQIERRQRRGDLFGTDHARLR